MDKWYLLYCKPKQELRAQQHLANQGFISYVPMITALRLRAGRKTVKTEPLFPRYLFLHVSASVQINLSTVRSTRGITDFVRFGDTLATVPDAVIALLTQKQTILQQQQVLSDIYKKGEAVEILSGPFTGLDAVYEMGDGEQRSVVLINLLGQWAKTSLANQHIEKKSG